MLAIWGYILPRGRGEFGFSKSRENLFSNVCHSSQWRDYKNSFTPKSSNQNNLFKNFGCVYIWEKYEPIWTDLTAQTVILRANMIVQAHTIPINAKCSLFF